MTRFGLAWVVGLMFGSLLVGCGRIRDAKAPLPTPWRQATASKPSAEGFELTRYSVQGPLAGAPAAAATSARSAPAPSVPNDPGENTPEPEVHELLDIEAHLGLLVASVSDARTQLRTLAAARGATVSSDTSSDVEGQRQADLVIRVPSGDNDAFMSRVERLGDVTSRQIVAKDVGKEYHDSEILLHNLERTLARYEQILQKAQSVEEILKIEAELSRIRSEIERVKGELRYLADRTLRATVFIAIHERGQRIACAREAVAKFFPGVRAWHSRSYAGVGKPYLLSVLGWSWVRGAVSIWSSTR